MNGSGTTDEPGGPLSTGSSSAPLRVAAAFHRLWLEGRAA
jgi:hypothetical protein